MKEKKTKNEHNLESLGQCELKSGRYFFHNYFSDYICLCGHLVASVPHHIITMHNYSPLLKKERIAKLGTCMQLLA